MVDTSGRASLYGVLLVYLRLPARLVHSTLVAHPHRLRLDQPSCHDDPARSDHAEPLGYADK